MSFDMHRFVNVYKTENSNRYQKGIKYTYSLYFHYCRAATCPEVWSPCAVSSKESSAAGEFDK